MARTRRFGILIQIVLEIATLGVKAYDCVLDENLPQNVTNIVFLSYGSAVLLGSVIWLLLFHCRPKYNHKVKWIQYIRFAEGVGLSALAIWSMLYGNEDHGISVGNFIASSLVLLDSFFYIIAYPMKRPSCCSKAAENSSPIYYIPTPSAPRLKLRLLPVWEYTSDGRFGYYYDWRYVYE